MIEGLLVALAIVLFTLSVFATTRGLHMLSASGLAQARSHPTVLYFLTDSCGPCLAQGRYLQQVIEEFSGQIRVENIDTSVQREVAARYGVFTVPTTLIVDQTGAVRRANHGLTDARKLRHQLRSLV